MEPPCQSRRERRSHSVNKGKHGNQRTCLLYTSPDTKLAKAISKSIITSSLTKAAMFGADANWGRILCAIGYTEGDFAVDTISVTISSPKGEILVCEKGAGVPLSLIHI